MPNFCTKVMQTFLMQKSDIFSDEIYKIILANGWCHIFLIDSKCIVSLIFCHEKYHFLLELLSDIEWQWAYRLWTNTFQCENPSPYLCFYTQIKIQCMYNFNKCSYFVLIVGTL